jgi:hypothetical protein
VMKVVSSVYVITKWRFYKYKTQNKLMIEPNDTQIYVVFS